VRHQDQRKRGPKLYSLHAPEVECIGKVRWSPRIGQLPKVGSPFEKDGSDDREAEALRI